MPVKSAAQRRAMFAALHGKSTVGIPKSVAEKYVGKKAHGRKRRRKGSDMRQGKML